MMIDDLSPEEEEEWRRLYTEYALARDSLADFERRHRGRAFHPFSREMAEGILSAAVPSTDVEPLVFPPPPYELWHPDDVTPLSPEGGPQPKRSQP
jgi:hypothetical protein